MGKIQSFNEFLTTRSAQIPIFAFIVNILIAAFLAWVLAIIYVKWGRALSNRKLFARNFLLLTTTTMLIITIVKSSLALSLGLVGALSIVRFRTAIKEPEELGYLLVCIAVGLGLGANQTIITIVGFAFICLFVLARARHAREKNPTNLHLTVATNQPNSVKYPDLANVLDRHCSMIDLKRLDDDESNFEASFLVEFKSQDSFNELKKDLRSLGGSLRISFLDCEGLF